MYGEDCSNYQFAKLGKKPEAGYEWVATLPKAPLHPYHR